MVGPFLFPILFVRLFPLPGPHCFFLRFPPVHSLRGYGPFPTAASKLYTVSFSFFLIHRYFVGRCWEFFGLLLFLWRSFRCFLLAVFGAHWFASPLKVNRTPLPTKIFHPFQGVCPCLLQYSCLPPNQIHNAFPLSPPPLPFFSFNYSRKFHLFFGSPSSRFFLSLDFWIWVFQCLVVCPFLPFLSSLLPF